MLSNSLVVGQKATIILDFPDAKVGDTYVVDVQTTHPNGIVTTQPVVYKILEDVANVE